MKFLFQIIVLGLILSGGVNAQQGVNDQQEAQRRAEEVAQATGHDVGCECMLCGSYVPEGGWETGSDVAPLTSLYEVTLVFDVKSLEENENFKSLVNELRDDTPDIKEVLINKFKSQYPTIVKLDLFQRNMVWTLKKADNDNTVLFLELTQKQVRSLERMSMDSPIVLTLKESSEKPALKFSEEQLDSFRKKCDPKDHMWIGLKYEELLELSIKKKTIVLLNSLDNVSISFPLDGSEEGELFLQVDVENGVVVNAVSYETAASAPEPR